MIIGEALVGSRQLGITITGAVMGSVLFRQRHIDTGLGRISAPIAEAYLTALKLHLNLAVLIRSLRGLGPSLHFVSDTDERKDDRNRESRDEPKPPPPNLFLGRNDVASLQTELLDA